MSTETSETMSAPISSGNSGSPAVPAVKKTTHQPELRAPFKFVARVASSVAGVVNGTIDGSLGYVGKSTNAFIHRHELLQIPYLQILFVQHSRFIGMILFILYAVHGLYLSENP